MAEANLVKVITWLRAKRRPCYALLPAAEYDKKWRSWNLPPPEKLGRRRDSIDSDSLIPRVVQIGSR